MEKAILKFIHKLFEDAYEKDRHSLFHSHTIHTTIWVRLLLKIVVHKDVKIVLVMKDGGDFVLGYPTVYKRVCKGNLARLAFVSLLGYTVFYTPKGAK